MPRAIAAVSLPAPVKGSRANVTAGLHEAELLNAQRETYAARQIDDNDRCQTSPQKATEISERRDEFCH